MSPDFVYNSPCSSGQALEILTREFGKRGAITGEVQFGDFIVRYNNGPRVLNGSCTDQSPGSCIEADWHHGPWFWFNIILSLAILFWAIVIQPNLWLAVSTVVYLALRSGLFGRLGQGQNERYVEAMLRHWLEPGSEPPKPPNSAAFEIDIR